MVMITPAIIRLTDAVSVASEGNVPDKDTQMMAFEAPREVLDIRNLRLQRSGWSLFLLKYFEAHSHISVLDWLECCKRHSLFGRHADCTGPAYFRDNRTYRMQHLGDDCQCFYR